jgi:asparagine synthase (glutamine-hydrolysing)
MSIIFGIHGVEGQPLGEQLLRQLGGATESYAHNGTTVLLRDWVGMGFQPQYTHERSNLEVQPAIVPEGDMLTFDGRLDNYEDLQRMLGIKNSKTADSFIALAAFEHWGEECFARFLGDWALALWSPRDRSLYLARDHAGTRTLYFERRKEYVLWSTYLETFFTDSRDFDLDQEYAVCYLAGRPLRDRTPYRTIRCIPPAHYLKIQEDRMVRCAHWTWTLKDRIHYRSDNEYEAHFIDVFGRAVARRTGPGEPTVVELSGGMDSTSIVCMSDALRRSCRSDVSSPLLDTISFYDDSEPGWNEKPYFLLVEERRGQSGIHIDTSLTSPTYEPLACGTPPLLPGTNKDSLARERHLESRLGGQYLSIVSGIGGDELLGGVPSPLPELADLMVGCRLPQLFSRALEWCLADRSPLLAMLSKTAGFLMRIYRHDGISTENIPDWIPPAARPLCRHWGFPHVEEGERFGLSPSTIENALTWWFLLESLPHLTPAQLVRREYRYPYLDKDLVEFLFRVPRAKLLGPGRRRAMMRSALRDIVPIEILERRRKAYVVRKPLISLQAGREKIRALFMKPLLAEHGLVVPSILQRAAHSVCEGREPQLWTSVMRCISFELWLQARSTSSPKAKLIV